MADPWTPLRQRTDKVRLNGSVLSPGLVRFEGLKQVRNFQVTDDVAGYCGGFVRFLGRKLTRFTTKFILITDADWTDYYKIKPVLDALPGFPGKAIQFDHPLPAALGITAVVFEEVGAPEPTNENGEWVVNLACIEFRKPKVQLSKVEAAKATPADPDAPAMDANTAGIDDLVDRLGKALTR